MHMQISLGTKFQLKLTILNFWIKFAGKEYFRPKSRKVNITIELCICELIDNFGFLDQIYPKTVFLVKNRKSEHRHWIPNIPIGLGTKFQLQLTILIFWAKFAKKGVSSLNWKFTSLLLTILNFSARGPNDKQYL